MNVGAKSGRGHDACATRASLLEQPGLAIASDQKIGLRDLCHGQQKGVVRVIGFSVPVPYRKRVQYHRMMQMVHHRSNAMRWKNGFELGIAACTPEFVQLHP